MQPTATTAAPIKLPSKSRRRWYVLALLLVLIATPIAWYFIVGWQGEREMDVLLAELDAEEPGWRWPDLLAAMEPISDEENSVAQIIKVRNLAMTPVVFNPGPKWDNANRIPNTRLNDSQAQAVEAVFTRCDPALRPEARKLKEMPRGRFRIPVEGNPFQFDRGDYQQSRTTIYVLQVDAALRAHEGDFDGAAQSCQAMLNVTGVFKGDPFLIGYLVRAAEHAITVAAIERTLGQGAVSEPELKKLQELLQREADSDGFLQAMRGERAAAHLVYSQIQNGEVSISEIFGKRGIGAVESDWTGRLLDAFPSLILKDYPGYLRTMNATVRACKLDPKERSNELAKIEQKIRTEGNTLSRMISPAMAKVAEAARRDQAFLRCATAAVAAERYRLKHDAWPRSLDDLVKEELLAKVPTDPYDGNPLRLKRTATGVIVYSVGRDGIDNGGNLNRSNWLADGSDFGFELWDHPKMRSLPPPVEEK